MHLNFRGLVIYEDLFIYNISFVFNFHIYFFQFFIEISVWGYNMSAEKMSLPKSIFFFFYIQKLSLWLFFYHKLIDLFVFCNRNIWGE